MVTAAYIRVTGGWAALSGASQDVLEAVCAAEDPECKHSTAYREGRWDGVRRLYENNRFPSGLADNVADYIRATGRAVKIVEPLTKPLDLGMVTENFYPPVPKYDYPGKLWAHQLEAVRTLLTYARCSVKSGTGSGKTLVLLTAALCYWFQRGWSSVVVVPKKGLLDQTVAVFRAFCNEMDAGVEIGRCGDGTLEIGPITVTTAQTLCGYKARKHNGRWIPANADLRRLVKETEVLFFDECHRASSETWYDIALQSNAIRRHGVSGTPLKNDVLKDMRFIAATGPVRLEVESSGLIEKKLCSKPKIVMVMSENASGPMRPHELRVRANHGHIEYHYSWEPYAKAYRLGLIENDAHNRSVVLAASWLVDHKRPTLVLCRTKAHFLRLKELLQETGIEFRAVWGDTDVMARNKAKALLCQRKIMLILATTIFDEGEDIKAVGAMVLAEGVKSFTVAMQRIGRGTRRESGRDDLWVVDFVTTCHPTIMSHGWERCKAYETEDGYEVRVQETWPVDPAHPTTPEYENLLPFLSWGDSEPAQTAQKALPCPVEPLSTPKRAQSASKAPKCLKTGLIASVGSRKSVT